MNPVTAFEIGARLGTVKRAVEWEGALVKQAEGGGVNLSSILSSLQPYLPALALGATGGAGAGLAGMFGGEEDPETGEPDRGALARMIIGALIGAPLAGVGQYGWEQLGGIDGIKKLLGLQSKEEAIAGAEGPREISDIMTAEGPQTMEEAQEALAPEIPDVEAPELSSETDPTSAIDELKGQDAWKTLIPEEEQLQGAGEGDIAEQAQKYQELGSIGGPGEGSGGSFAADPDSPTGQRQMISKLLDFEQNKALQESLRGPGAVSSFEDLLQQMNR